MSDFDSSYDSQAEQSRGSFSEQLDLQAYLRILRKNKWPIALFTAIVTALSIYYVTTATPIYSASSTLLIESQRANMVSVEELYGIEKENSDYYQTQYELLKSRKLGERVINVLGLFDESGNAGAVSSDGAAGSENLMLEETSSSSVFQNLLSSLKNLVGVQQSQIEPTQEGGGIEVIDSAEIISANLEPETAEEIRLRKEGAISGFMGGLTISPIRKTKLVKISYESADPELAAKVANAIGEQYILSYLDAKMEMTTKASSWLSERLGTLKVTLDTSERALLEYKQEHGLVDVGGSVARLNEQEMLITTSDLSEARRNLSDATSVYREVQGMRNDSALLETLPGVQADSLVRSVKIEQGQRQRELDELLNRYGNRHPKVIDARSRLESLNATLTANINRAVSVIENNYQLARQRVSSLQRSLQQGKQEIQNLGTKTFELEALEREVTTNRDLYNTFFARMSEAKSADGLETANARISDYAIIPRTPVKPKKQLIVALATLASLVLSMLMAFLYEQMDDTIKSTDDIERKLGVRLLGILPLIKSGFLNQKKPLPLNPTELVDKKGTFVEAVNTVRTAVSAGDDIEKNQVVLVTSSIPGEGKSTTALNLAYSMAQMERVLLIDCDLRRPTIAKAIKLDRDTAGLANLITKTAGASECIRKNAIGSLDVLTSGPTVERPLELMSSNRFASIIRELSKHYDRIVIDCAPTQAVSDALVISKLVDAIIYCVKSHDTSIELARRGLQRLAQVDAPVSGVLMTQVDIDKLQSYGGDHYYQGYYDYYGYSEKDSSSGSKSRLTLTPQELQQIRSDDAEFVLDETPARVAGATGHTRGLTASNESSVGLGVSAESRDAIYSTKAKVDRNLTMVEMGEDFSGDEFDLTTRINERHTNGLLDDDQLENGKSAETFPRRESARIKFTDDLDII